MIVFICDLFDYVMSGYSAIISVINSSTSVYLERLRRSIHFDSTSPLLRRYSRVIPGGKYLIRIFFSFILKILSFIIYILQKIFHIIFP